jgi:phosphoribosylformylglycinamidine synthase
MTKLGIELQFFSLFWIFGVNNNGVIFQRKFKILSQKYLNFSKTLFNFQKNYNFGEILNKKTMKFIAHINVMPLPNLLDPQGKAVKQVLQNLKYNSVSNVRIGKHITLEFDAEDEDTAKQIADEISRKVLTNQVVETYKIKIEAK